MSNDPNMQSLISEKERRNEASTAVDAAAVEASCDTVDLAIRKARVTTLETARANAVETCNADSVIAVDAELLRARVAVEIAQAKSAATAARHSAAIASLRQVEVEVRKAAEAIVLDEMIDLAGALNASMDRAMEIGAELEALSMREGRPTAIGTGPSVPAAVTRALERLPTRNPLDIPVYELRGGGMQSDRWARRLEALTADSIDVIAA
jgi:hypothetical protein